MTIMIMIMIMKRVMVDGDDTGDDDGNDDDDDDDDDDDNDDDDDDDNDNDMSNIFLFESLHVSPVSVFQTYAMPSSEPDTTNVPHVEVVLLMCSF